MNDKQRDRYLLWNVTRYVTSSIGYLLLGIFFTIGAYYSPTVNIHSIIIGSVGIVFLFLGICFQILSMSGYFGFKQALDKSGEFKENIPMWFGLGLIFPLLGSVLIGGSDAGILITAGLFSFAVFFTTLWSVKESIIYRKCIKNGEFYGD